MLTTDGVPLLIDLDRDLLFAVERRRCSRLGEFDLGRARDVVRGLNVGVVSGVPVEGAGDQCSEEKWA